jgi:type II secretory pathway pseudopilin PulG
VTARKAFTLVETIATMTVLAALGTVLSFMIGGAAASYADAATRSELSVALSVALDHIDRELRNIELDTGASVPAPDIDLVEPARIEWSGDWSLSLSGSNLEIVRGGAPSAVLMSDVTSLTIQAFDESNTALASSLSGSACDPIRRLSIEVTVQRAGIAETLRSKVFIRSLTTGAGS